MKQVAKNITLSEENFVAAHARRNYPDKPSVRGQFNSEPPPSQPCHDQDFRMEQELETLLQDEAAMKSYLRSRGVDYETEWEQFQHWIVESDQVFLDFGSHDGCVQQDQIVSDAKTLLQKKEEIPDGDPTLATQTSH